VNPLLKDIRHNPLLWLLAFVPVLFAVEKLKPEAHTLLFVLSVLASDTLPVELDEAATMDGATTLQLFRLVYVPLMMPSLCRRIPTSRFPSRSATFSPPTTHHGNC
jgi:hypothetical protein